MTSHCYTDYGKLLSSALALEKERTGADKIKSNNRLMRAGMASTVTQEHGRKRTRDDVVSPGGALQFRAPQSSMTVPSQPSNS